MTPILSQRSMKRLAHGLHGSKRIKTDQNGSERIHPIRVNSRLKACLEIGFRIVSPGIHSGVQGVRIDKNRFNGFTYVLSKPLKRFGVEARPDPRNKLRG
jgi:hypothetical protein